ncbi:predicted protein [Arabidopsis lyrata subsp. lyrata]|uniref:Predicted protein n=1 Tax=Arabidopsis lyrata subsp. lyrata TaxID=81972 RepID=D7L3E6_ARALL|nr:predicted protein [Arabidopsis lyrata subsp. lyrata]
MDIEEQTPLDFQNHLRDSHRKIITASPIILILDQFVNPMKSISFASKISRCQKQCFFVIVAILKYIYVKDEGGFWSNMRFWMSSRDFVIVAI